MWTNRLRAALTIPAAESFLAATLCVCAVLNAALLVAVIYLVELVVRQRANEAWLLIQLMKP